MPEKTVSPTVFDPTAETLIVRIDTRTARRIRHLRVDCAGNRITVRGLASSYHVMQLALAAVREVCPATAVDLDICVR